MSYAWRVRAEAAEDDWDGSGEASVWSGWCEFTVDTVAPVVPVVSSSDFPENEAGPAVGTPGTFVFAPGTSTDVVAYRYGLNTDTGVLPNTVTVPPGGTATVTIAPTGFVNWVNVRSVDRAGNLSPLRTYLFYAATEPEPPQTPQLAGYWKLDEAAGTTAADSSGNSHTAALTGGAAWTGGHNATAGAAVDLDGVTGYAATAGPVAGTDRSFTVAAWVRPSTVAGDAVAVSQHGRRVNGYALGYSTDPLGGGAAWTFGVPGSDQDGAAIHQTQDAFDPVQAGAWTHLTGVYDADHHELRLYVNGQFVDATAHTTPWPASGDLLIGRGLTDGTAHAFWPGALDDVRVYDGALSDQDIFALSQS